MSISIGHPEPHSHPSSPFFFRATHRLWVCRGLVAGVLSVASCNREERPTPAADEKEAVMPGAVEGIEPVKEEVKEVAERAKTGAVAVVAAAHADVKNAEDEVVARVTFSRDDTLGGVRVDLKCFDLPPGPHAFHIHEKGDCGGEPFGTAAGGHFNPTGNEHGMENPRGQHLGDMPNVEVKADGSCELDYVIKGATLDRDQKTSILREGGTAIMFHEKADDNKTDPAGAAGARIACGVITAGAGDR